MLLERLVFYVKHKWKYFFVFCLPFVTAFFLTFKDAPDRAIKCMVCSCLFSVLFSVVAVTWKDCFLPIVCGVLFYLGTAGTFYFHSMSIGAAWCEVHYELIFAESLACMLLFADKLAGKFRIVVSVIEWFILLISCAYIGYFAIFSSPIDSDTFFILLQTNWKEATRFVAHDMVAFVLAVVFSIMLLLAVICFNSNNKQSDYSKKSLPVQYAVVIFMLFCIVWDYFVVFKGEHLYIHRDLSIACGYMKQIKAMAGGKNTLGEISASNKVDNIVLVIGESANRDYMGCYGYDRQNTPWMSSLQERENVVFFDHVYTSYRLTNKALAYFLTEKSQYNDKDLYGSLNVVDVMNAAGYDTYWISIQGNASNYREVYNVIAQRSKHTKFLEGGLDEKLLPYLDIPVDNQKKFIVVHLVGSHHPYTSYPPEYNLYGEDTVSDRYDNTIAYTDYVLSEIYKKLSVHQPELFIYASDHGESKDMMRNKFDFRMTHVPFVVLFSDDFMSSYPEVYHSAMKKRHAYFSHDMFYDTFLDILGINKEFYDSRQSLFSDEYAYSKENIKSEYGAVDVKDDPYST